MDFGVLFSHFVCSFSRSNSVHESETTAVRGTCRAALLAHSRVRSGCIYEQLTFCAPFDLSMEFGVDLTFRARFSRRNSVLESETTAVRGTMRAARLAQSRVRSGCFYEQLTFCAPFDLSMEFGVDLTFRARFSRRNSKGISGMKGF